MFILSPRFHSLSERSRVFIHSHSLHVSTVSGKGLLFPFIHLVSTSPQSLVTGSCVHLFILSPQSLVKLSREHLFVFSPCYSYCHMLFIFVFFPCYSYLYSFHVIHICRRRSVILSSVLSMLFIFVDGGVNTNMSPTLDLRLQI